MESPLEHIRQDLENTYGNAFKEAQGRALGRLGAIEETVSRAYNNLELKYYDISLRAFNTGFYHYLLESKDEGFSEASMVAEFDKLVGFDDHHVIELKEIKHAVKLYTDYIYNSRIPVKEVEMMTRCIEASYNYYLHGNMKALWGSGSLSPWDDEALSDNSQTTQAVSSSSDDELAYNSSDSDNMDRGHWLNFLNEMKKNIKNNSHARQ
ncbi:MAG: hypothetical protein IPP74_09455 [Alphaproteobacteria bacterium]|nr:hypothetical protein [Alphaproteobacteria bacterium]